MRQQTRIYVSDTKSVRGRMSCVLKRNRKKEVIVERRVRGFDADEAEPAPEFGLTYGVAIGCRNLMNLVR